MAAPTFPAREVAPLRNRMGLTQQDFADRVGVARTLVTHWESGIRTPRGPAAILLQQLSAFFQDERKKTVHA